MKAPIYKLSLFASLDRDAVDRVTREFPRKSYKKGEMILKQGRRDLVAHVLLEGKVGVYAQSPEGVKTAIIFHEAPYIIGQIEIWQEMPYLGSVIATEPCRTMLITRKAFLQMLHSNHQVCINLVQILSDLLYRTAKDRRMRIFGRVEHLVANVLCSFAQLYGEEHPYGVLIRKEINKSEIAQILGVARRSVLRAFDMLLEEKLIEVDRKQLVIPDIERLRTKANAPFPDFLPD